MLRSQPVRDSAPNPAPAPEAPTLGTTPPQVAGGETTDSALVWPYPIEESPRRLRVAVAAAAALHALLLLIPMPDTRAEMPDPEKKEYLVIPVPLLKRPPPEPETIPVCPGPPRPIPVLVPVRPDPEPIRPAEVLPPVYDLPPLDPAIDLPDAPPPIEPERHGPYVIGGPVSAPVRLEAPTPIYPEMARIARRECTVLLKSVIDESGRVTEIEVERECPFGMTGAAVDAVERWRYRPATRTGLPVPVYMNLRVAFTLSRAVRTMDPDPS